MLKWSLIIIVALLLNIDSIIYYIFSRISHVSVLNITTILNKGGPKTSIQY